MSIRMFESSRVAVTLLQASRAPVLSPGQSHDLVGGHRVVPTRLAEMRDDLLASPFARFRLANPDLPVFSGNKFDLGAGEQAIAIPHTFRDRHLAFAGDP